MEEKDYAIGTDDMKGIDERVIRIVQTQNNCRIFNLLHCYVFCQSFGQSALSELQQTYPPGLGAPPPPFFDDMVVFGAEKQKSIFYSLKFFFLS